METSIIHESTAAPAAKPAQDWLRALETIAEATRDPQRTLPRAVGEWARRYADSTALISDRKRFSFAEFATRMNRYSRWALGTGVRSGEPVALIMGTRLEYFAIWLGLAPLSL